MSRIRVLLVDDNDDFLEGVAAWLAGEPEFEVIGTAHSGREAIEQVERLGPEVVLMDVTMPDMNGFEAARSIKSHPGAPRVILTTFHVSEAARHEAWAAGADGFLAKADVTQRFMKVVEEMLAGRAGRSSDRGPREPHTSAAGVHSSPSKKQGPPRDLSS